MTGRRSSSPTCSVSSGGITLATVGHPYGIDQSVMPGTIIANFTPQLEPLVAGSVIAVKIANTAPGETRIVIDGGAPIDLQPNGGGRMSEATSPPATIAVFFHGGVDFFFPPNPEINRAGHLYDRILYQQSLRRYGDGRLEAEDHRRQRPRHASDVRPWRRRFPLSAYARLARPRPDRRFSSERRSP